MIFRQFLVAALVFSACGCAAQKTSVLSPVHSDQVSGESRSVRGFDAASSKMRQTAAHVAAFRSTKGSLVFHTVLENYGISPMDVDPKNIRLYLVNNGKKEEHKIIAAEDYVEDLRGEYQQKQFMSGVLSEVVGIAGGIASGFVPYAGAAVALAHQALINPQVDKKLRSSLEASREDIRITADVLMKPHRLYPNTESEGLVIAEFKRADEYQLLIPVGSEVHMVKFNFNENSFIEYDEDVVGD